MVHWIFLVIAFTAGCWFGFFVIGCCMVASESDRHSPAPPPLAYDKISNFVWIKENADE